MTPRSLKFLALLVSALAVSGYAVWGYGSGTQRAVVHPDMIRSFDAHRSLITLHALGAAIALLVGPFQFLTGLRARRPVLHRRLGYLYLSFGVGLGGTSGLLLAFSAYGGFVSGVGFFLLPALWLFTGLRALVTAKQRKFDLHRVWMTRNYALAFAAVTLRIYLVFFRRRSRLRRILSVARLALLGAQFDFCGVVASAPWELRSRATDPPVMQRLALIRLFAASLALTTLSACGHVNGWGQVGPNLKPTLGANVSLPLGKK